MKLSMFITSISFLCACLAAPRGRPRQDDGSLDQFVFPAWPITNLTEGCSLGGCLIFFGMSSSKTATEPGVSARCAIIRDNLAWQECEALPGNKEETNGSVWAFSFASYGSNVVSLQHRFVNDSVAPFRSWNVTTNISEDYELPSLPVDFTVHALSVSETGPGAHRKLADKGKNVKHIM